MKKLNHFVKSGKVKLISFPGSTSKQMLHYLDEKNSETSDVKAFVIHVGVNGIINNNSQSNVGNL